MKPDTDPDRADQTIQAARVFASATSTGASTDLYEPMTFLLAQVRQALGMDVVFVSQFVDQSRVFEVVSAAGEHASQFTRGHSDPLLDTYCQRIVEGRLPAVIRDTHALPAAAQLPITQALQIRAYLSAPVRLANGSVFGTLCCISHSPRQDLRERDAQALAEVAKAVAASIGPSGRIRYASWTGDGG
jgi:GAF domain-containing protein